jgi:hypothetical protein
VWAFLVSQGLVEDDRRSRVAFREALRKELDRGEITGPSLPRRVACHLDDVIVDPEGAGTPDPWGNEAKAAFEAFTPPEPFAVPEGPMDQDRVTQLEAAFVWAFLPPITRSPHGLLYDFEEKYEFTPTPEALEACLCAYLDLLRAAMTVHPAVVRGILKASELALAYVARAVSANLPLAGLSCRNGIIDAAEKVLKEARDCFPRPNSLDGFKRVDAIASALRRF